APLAPPVSRPRGRRPHTSAHPLRKRDGRPARLVAVEAEVERIGGETGGWTREDHDRFMSERRKAGVAVRVASLQVWLERIAPRFPHHSIGALAHHEGHCCRMEELDKEKKLLVEKWRVRQEERQREARQEEKREEALRTHSAGSSRAHKNAESEREAKAERLRAWQEQRAMEREDDAAHAERAQRAKRRERHMRTEEFKRKRQAEEDAKAEAEKEKAALALKMQRLRTQREGGVGSTPRAAALSARQSEEAHLRRREAEIRQYSERASRQRRQGERNRTRRQRVQQSLLESSTPVAVRAVKRDAARLSRPTSATTA
ncbi:hypothetical protein KIPB_012309, partial [Kipferlia bialata]